MTDIDREIARCDDEIARMEAQDGNAPAYLVTMGVEDWRRERRMLEELSRANDRPYVTPRELAVLNLVADGNSTEEIAKLLGMTPKTAACHRSKLLTKFGARNAAALVRHAIRIGLIDA